MLFDQVKNILKPNHILRFSSLLKKNQCIKHFRRFLHNEEESSKAKFLCPLKSRSLLKITGCDASSFLQGLITNDMLHFQHGTKTMYALFLNNKGRILYDTLVHKWDSEDHNFLIECDKKVLSSLEKHLRIYKLKRNVEITDMTDALKVWVIVAPQESVPDLTINPDGVNVYKDPRVANLGTRVITASNVSPNMIIESLGSNTNISENEDDYKSIRYMLGVGEGIQDLFPGTIFPLEANCDYLHGVSFHKGCYIGQELLARVHYRGVVRKRIMPIKLLHENPVNISQNCPLIDCDTNKEVGKIKGFLGKCAIGMLRIKEALEAKKLRVGIYEAETYRPVWWPKEAPKEVTKTAS